MSAFDSYTYEVNQSGDQVNTLRIKQVNESLAGTYFCSEGVAESASAQLIVYGTVFLYIFLNYI